MADIEQAKQRFTEIALDWGLQTERTQERLEAVAGYLDRAVKEPGVAVRATQLVLLDPESSGAPKRECYKEVLPMLGDAWLEGARDLRLLQAMLLAIGVPQGCAVHGLAGALWDLSGCQSGQRRHMNGWGWEGNQIALANSVRVTDDPDPVSTKKTASSAGLQTTLASIQATGVHNAAAGLKDVMIPFLTSASEEFDLLHKQLSIMRDQLSTWSRQISNSQASLKANMDAILSHVRIQDPTSSEFLWWGQARYCHTLRRPFRRLYKDDAQRELALLHACMEAAERAKMLAPEPAAAFLVETLRAIGWDVEEVRTVQSWMDSAFNTLRAADGLPALNPALNALAAKDALGLPWTHLRLKVGDPRTHGAQAADILLPPDAEIDRGLWATWIFREAVLNLRMAP